MQILGLLGMYFDAAMVFVTISSLLFRLALAILTVSGVNIRIRIRNLLQLIVAESKNGSFLYVHASRKVNCCRMTE